MLLFRHRVGLVRQHPQRTNDFRPRLVWLDYIVDITALGRNKRIRKSVSILIDLCLPNLLGILGRAQLAPI